MLRVDRLAGPLLIAMLLVGAAPAVAQAPAGEVAVSFHVTLAPTWFDPSTAPPQISGSSSAAVRAMPHNAACSGSTVSCGVRG